MILLLLFILHCGCLLYSLDYAVDVVSMSLETRHGVWMAEVPIKPKGISKKKRTIGTPEFRHYTEFEGRFVNLLPLKDGAETLH